MNNREFYGVEFYAFCQREYDKAREHLKKCGKPADDYDKTLIEIAKFDARLFWAML